MCRGLVIHGIPIAYWKPEKKKTKGKDQTSKHRSGNILTLNRIFETDVLF